MNLDQYKVTMPAAEYGDYRVDVVHLTEEDLGIWGGVSMEEYFMGRSIPPGTYRRLSSGAGEDKVIWMSDTPAEIMDHMEAIFALNGSESALINGLGLGLVVQAALQQPTMRRVTVVEMEHAVIQLVGEHYEKMAADAGVDLRIVHDDALTYAPAPGVRFDVVWHDIWPQISAGNLPQMRTLHRRYGKRARWQGSWARRLCHQMHLVERQLGIEDE